MNYWLSRVAPLKIKELQTGAFEITKGNYKVLVDPDIMEDLRYACGRTVDQTLADVVIGELKYGDEVCMWDQPPLVARVRLTIKEKCDLYYLFRAIRDGKPYDFLLSKA